MEHTQDYFVQLGANKSTLPLLSTSTKLAHTVVSHDGPHNDPCNFSCIASTLQGSQCNNLK